MQPEYDWLSGLRVHVGMTYSVSHSPVHLHRATLNPSIPQPILIPGIDPTQVQSLSLVELHEFCMGPSLKPVLVPLASLPSSMSISPHSLVLSAKSLRLHSVPPPMSPTKMLKSPGSNTDPGTWLPRWLGSISAHRCVEDMPTLMQ